MKIHKLSIHSNILFIIIFIYLLSNLSCMPSQTIDYDGHRVFNPIYLFYLESDNRDQWQKPEQIIKALQLSEGDVIADIGAGGGYFTQRFSQKVGKNGHVYATDVQKVMIDELTKRVKEQKLTNVTVIHSKFTDPMLPENSCDIVFFSSVYKEIDGRISFMKKIKKSLKKRGRVAIIEYRRDANVSGPRIEARLHPMQIIEELNAAGFKLSKKFDLLSSQHFFLFVPK